MIVLNEDFTSGQPSLDSGLEVKRGDEPSKFFIWDETNNTWSTQSEKIQGSFEGDVIGNLTGNVIGEFKWNC